MKKITGKSKFNIKKLPHRIVNDEKGKEYSKLFVTMDHKTLIQKLEKKHQYIDRFKSLSKLLESVCKLLSSNHTLRKN